MNPDPDAAAFREAVLTLMNEGFAFVVLAFSLLVLLAAVAVVRHW